MKYLISAVLLCILSFPSFAFSEEQNSDGTTRTIQDYISSYVDVPEGATDWKVFGKTKEVEVSGRDKDGMDFEYIKPEFPPAVKALNGKTVTVKGFMFPLEGEEKQSLFLIGPFPVSCPFHYHVGPSLVIEVHTGPKPIEFTYDPITVTGTLELVDLDIENAVFYRLKNAALQK